MKTAGGIRIIASFTILFCLAVQSSSGQGLAHLGTERSLRLGAGTQISDVEAHAFKEYLERQAGSEELKQKADASRDNSALRQKKEFSKGEEVREAEERLSALGYWTGPVDGQLDGGSRLALTAFQKVEGRERTGKLTEPEIQALRSAKRPLPFESGYAHIEIDLKRQVLFIVDAGGTVSKILPVSTGNGELFTSEGWTRRAITPCGRFTIFRKVPGWHKSPLGLLYYPNYILGGVAIHGSPFVPAKPASHGCIRIPMFAAKEFSEMNPIGTAVMVHDGTPP